LVSIKISIGLCTTLIQSYIARLCNTITVTQTIIVVAISKGSQIKSTYSSNRILLRINAWL